MASVDEIVAAEARGDESNLKGTTYHLGYALWLLVVKRVEPVLFFAGNDLLANPIRPPQPEHWNVASLCSVEPHYDNWIQLKCTAKPWTCSSLLDENLLRNFVVNSFVSERNNRKYRIRLITTADIRQADIRNFANSPTLKPKLNSKFEGVVASALDVIANAWPNANFTTSKIRHRAIEVLKEIAECTRVSVRELEAELTAELSLLCGGDRTTVGNVRRKLIGGMLEGCKSDGAVAKAYDLKWVQEVTGLDLDLLEPEQSFASTCDRQVEQAIPIDFSLDKFAARPILSELDVFLEADEHVFVLQGAPGTGKSWSLAAWATQKRGVPRLFIPGNRLSVSSSLGALVASAVRSAMHSTLDDHQLFAMAVRVSRAAGSPLTVIIDNVSPGYSDARTFESVLTRLADEAATFQIKLVFSAQSDVVANLQPFRSIVRVFFLTPPGETDSASAALANFTQPEVEDAIRRRLPAASADFLIGKTRDPAFAILRNPYLLDAVVRGSDSADLAIPENLGTLVELQIERTLEQAKEHCNLTTNQLREILAKIAVAIFERHGTGKSGEIVEAVKLEFSDRASEAFSAFQATGLVVEVTTLTISDQHVAARLVAQHLATKNPADIEQQLHISSDHQLVVHLLSILEQPQTLGHCLISLDERWISVVAEGLSFSTGDEHIVEAFLLALSRRGIAREEVFRSIARYAVRCNYAWNQLCGRFIEGPSPDQHIAEYVLQAVAEVAPMKVCDVVRQRWEHRNERSPGAHDSEKFLEHRKQLADALDPLMSIIESKASRYTLSMLDEFEDVVKEAFWRNREPDDRASVCFSDPLVTSVAETRLLAATHGDHRTQAEILSRIHSDSLEERVTTVYALAEAAERLPVQYKSQLWEVIQSESHPGIYATAAWQGARLAKEHPREFVSAVSRNRSTAWASYESTAATLAGLERAAISVPSEVMAVLPPNQTNLSDESYWQVQELLHVCRHRCEMTLGISLPILPFRSNPLGGDLTLYQYRSVVVQTLLDAARRFDVQDTPPIYRTCLRHRGTDFFQAKFSPWFRRHHKEILDKRLEDRLTQLTVELTTWAHLFQANVLHKWHRDVRYWFVVDCLDVLSVVCANRHDCVKIVKQLPDDWEQLYVIRQLLELGNTDDGLVDLAILECEVKEHSATAQASSERTGCLKVLQDLVPDRIPPTRDELSGFFLRGSGPERAVALLEAKPEHVPETLDSVLVSEGDLLLLKDWNGAARSWMTVCISTSYRRMFELKPIASEEALLLCRLMVKGLKGCVESDITSAHMAVYSAAIALLTGEELKVAALPNTNNAITKSHRCAMRLFQVNPISLKDTRQTLIESRCWFESNNHKWADGRLDGFGAGDGYYALVLPPAVRLGLCAVGTAIAIVDLGGDWMRERHAGVIFEQKQGRGIQHASEATLVEIEAELSQFPDHESLHATYGHALLVFGRIADAESALKKALSLPLCEGQSRGRVFYNLACAYVRSGRRWQCLNALRASARFKALDLDWIAKDTDFDAVREARWFRCFVKLERWKREWKKASTKIGRSAKKIAQGFWPLGSKR